jgi:hypothetical protein
MLLILIQNGRIIRRQREEGESGNIPKFAGIIGEVGGLNPAAITKYEIPRS